MGAGCAGCRWYKGEDDAENESGCVCHEIQRQSMFPNIAASSKCQVLSYIGPESKSVCICSQPRVFIVACTVSNEIRKCRISKRRLWSHRKLKMVGPTHLLVHVVAVGSIFAPSLLYICRSTYTPSADWARASPLMISTNLPRVMMVV